MRYQYTENNSFTKTIIYLLAFIVISYLIQSL